MKMSALDLADIRNIIHQPLNITPCRLQLVQVLTDNRLLVNMRFGNIGKSKNCVKGGDFAVEMIKRGDIFGSSFAYALNEKDKTKVSYSMKDGLLLRTVHA